MHFLCFDSSLRHSNSAKQAPDFLRLRGAPEERGSDPEIFGGSGVVLLYQCAEIPVQLKTQKVKLLL